MSPQRRYRALVETHLDVLYRYAFSLERDAARAEDLLQQALLIGLEKIDQLREDGAARVWLTRIVYRTFLNQRAARREETGMDNVVELPGAQRPDRQAATRQLGQTIVAALDKLPNEQRDALWRVDGQGFKYAEAAQVLAIAPGTVASRVARARVALRVDLHAVALDEGVIR